MLNLEKAKTPNWFLNDISQLGFGHRGKALSTTGSMFSEGRRNNDMASLAGFLRSKGAGEEEIYSYLKGVNGNTHNPLPISELLSISKSIGRYDIKPDVFTHDKFAKVFADKYKNEVLYCAGRGFCIFDGRRWEKDAEGLKTLEY